MNRWLTQAIFLGVISSEASANNAAPWLSPKQLPLSSSGGEDSEDFNPSNVVFEYMRQCAEASLDRDTCLVSKTLDFLFNMDDDGGDTSNPSRLRFLQSDDYDYGDCGPPPITEEALMFIMAGARDQCSSLSLEFTDEEFDGTLAEFMKVFQSESCWQSLCEENNPLFFQIMLDEAGKCAQVDLDADQCIIDHLFDATMGSSEEEEGDDDGANIRRALEHSSCHQPSMEEWTAYISYMLSGAEESCLESGVSLEPNVLDKATSDFVQIFSSPHCMGNEDFNDDGDCQQYDDDDDAMIGAPPNNEEGGLNYAHIGIHYIERCTGLELDFDDCMMSTSLDMLMGSSTPQVPLRRNLNECGAPPIDEPTLQYMVESARYQCSAQSNLQYMDEEFDNTVATLMDFFGAEDCFTSLCEEYSRDSPSELFVAALLTEVAHCAGAELGLVNNCLMDQVFALVFSGDDSNEGNDDATSNAFGVRARRSLEHALGVEDAGSESTCDQPNEEDAGFVAGLLLMGAAEQCFESGVELDEADVETAYLELLKLFMAPSKCWGIGDGCDEQTKNEPQQPEHGPVHESFLEFVDNGAVSMLAQCADAEQYSCVFHTSIEVMHAMRHLGAAHDGIISPNSIMQQEVAGYCEPPSIYEFDEEEIAQIASRAMQQCTDLGAPVDEEQYHHAIDSLIGLLDKPHCWEEICLSESKEKMIGGWMQMCAYTDMKFLTNSSYVSSTPQMPLEYDKLMCMTSYIVDKRTGGGLDSLACSLNQLGTGVCGIEAELGKEAYIVCSGGLVPQHPTPTPPIDLSMSFSFEEYDWNEFASEQDFGKYEMSFSYSFDDLFGDLSMSYGNGNGINGGGDPSGYHAETNAYVIEVCSLLESLQSGPANECLKPVCDIGIDGAFIHYAAHGPTVEINESDDILGTELPTVSPTLLATSKLAPSAAPPSLSPSAVPSSSPSASLAPLYNPTKLTKKPTSKPTNKPTAQAEFGSVEVLFEVAITLDGINMSDLDVTSLDSMVDLLEKVLANMLPEGARVRLLKVGGFAVTRRLLRFLEENATQGVDVEFEVIMTKQCDSAKCDNSEDLSTALYDEVTNGLKAKIDNGSLTTAIQEEAEAEGVSELTSVTVKVDSLKTSAPKVTVKEVEGTDDDLVVEPNDDDSSSATCGLTFSIVAVVATAMAMSV
jgi:hypothetical protein